MDTPIIFIIFNRPNNTRVVFESIKKVRPKKLIVIADGPRSHKEGEKEKCIETRNIINKIDWECEVIKDYSEVNLGCKKRVSSGITNAFSLVDEAIILEDDCVPNESFFKFCEEMLERYRSNEKIMSITGDNFLFNNSSIVKDSYYFSKFPYIWGWATWKRAWEKYDIDMVKWPEAKKRNLIPNSWTKRFEDAYQNNIDTWDLQWTFTCLLHKGLTVVPKENLVSNIGFTVDASHTKIKTIVSEMLTVELPLPLIHPNEIITNNIADRLSQFHFTRTGIILDYIKQLFTLRRI